MSWTEKDVIKESTKEFLSKSVKKRRIMPTSCHKILLKISPQLA